MTVAVRTRREWALVLAAMGLLVFPLPPRGKEPFPKYQMGGRGWKEYMTSDAAIINEWFDEIKDMNYAVSPGDNFMVVDADEKKERNGVAHFIELNTEQPMDDWCVETFVVVSPSAGKHFYLRTPHSVASSAGTVAYGVDVRGKNGYVVGPGCYTEEVRETDGKIKQFKGDYTVEDERELATAPQWLLNKTIRHYEVRRDSQAMDAELDRPADIERAREFLASRAPAIADGSGEPWTYQTLGFVKDFGVSAETCLSLLMAPGGWASRCKPEWEAEGLVKKINNIFYYGQNAPGSKSDLFEKPGAFSEEEYLKGLAEQVEAKRHELSEHLFSPDRITSSEEYREMVIPDWLVSTGFTALLARRSTGKTVVMMDMACRIACDMNWYDMPVMEDFAVVYICGEDDIGARDMFRAWVKKHEKQPAADRFFFLDKTCDLMSRDSCELWTRFLLDQLKGKRAVIFLDTWQRATSRGAQSDEADMQTAIHHIEAIAKSLCGPCVVAAHPPKADTSSVMGSSIIENATAGIWHLTQEEGARRRLRVERVKGAPNNSYQDFNFTQIDLDRKNNFGRAITGIIPERSGGSSTKGTMEEQIAIEKGRENYATVIHNFMQRQGKNTITKKDVVVMIAHLQPHDDLYQLLQDARETPNNQPQVKRRLEQCFKDYGNSQVIDPENQVTLVYDELKQGGVFRYDRIRKHGEQEPLSPGADAGE